MTGRIRRQEEPDVLSGFLCREFPEKIARIAQEKQGFKPDS